MACMFFGIGTVNSHSIRPENVKIQIGFKVMEYISQAQINFAI